MTEAEWLACDHPVSMMELLPHKPDVRRLRLFACACCRRIWSLLGADELRFGVEAAEELAEGRLTDADHRQAIGRVEPHSMMGFPPHFHRCAVLWALAREDDFALIAAEYARDAVGYATTGGGGMTIPAGYKAAVTPEQIEQVLFVRDIFGNPFRPVALDPAWLTSDVVALARGIYEERAFDRMPILADALQDAGCDNDDILNHCRDEKQPHVRGCWIVDLLLGKE